MPDCSLSSRMWGRVCLFALLVGLALFPGRGALASPERLNLLVLSSFNKDLPAQAAFERGLDHVLGYRAGQSNVYFEFLDASRLPADQAAQGVRALIAKKYKDQRFDAVIAWAPPAAALAAASRDLLGEETPIIYLELSDTDVAAINMSPERDVSITVKTDYETSLSEALRLSQAKRIAVIVEQSNAMGRTRLNNFRQAKDKVAPNLPVDELFDLPLDETIVRTSKLPPGTIIYYLLMFSDGRGAQLTPFEAARRIAETANAPIFSNWESLMGSGVVGGYQLSIEVVGRNVGKAVQDISQDRPVTHPASMRHVYDWTQLDKWGWDDRKKLQPGSIILNQPPDLLEAYRWHLLTLTLFVLALIVLAVSLARALHAKNLAARDLARERETLAQRVETRTAELVRSNKELESFAYAISHDLRAPMRNINGFAQLLDRRFKDVLTGEGAEFLEHIRAGAQQMDAMILGLLDYSRVGHQSADSYSSASIPEITREAADMLQPLAASASGAIDVADRADLPNVRCNRELIRRLIQNLIENALKYRHPDRAPRVRIDFSPGKGEIKVSVRDNGIGIPEDRRERVFQLFQRDAGASIPGYGIGLAHCQRIVKAHGGDIWIESEPGGGSNFIFTLKENPSTVGDLS